GHQHHDRCAALRW
ncbi:hypothetical protein BN1723_020808, partial [Verticillium longisporum]